MAAIDPTLLATNDTPSRRTWPVRQAVLVGLLALILNLAGNGRISLFDRDEPRYAGATREMRASGDWVHPTFNAEPRYHKPVLIYWLMMAGTALGGDNPFGVRLVSSLAGAATCLVVWAWGRRMLGERAGLLAGLILATAPIVVAESKMATTDATLMLWVVGCQFCLWELSQRSSWKIAALFWTLLGLAILTKSPAGPVLLVASGAVSWWLGGPTSFLKRLHWRWGPLLCAAIVLPWNVAILLRSQGEYYHVAVGYHIIRRATSGLEEHGGFPGYYVVLSFLTCFPWSALLPAALYAGWSRRKESPVFGFLLGWIVGPLILLECVRTKLIHYYLPAFPAWALLLAWMLVAVTESEVTLDFWKMGRLAVRLLWVISAGAIAGLLAAAWFAPPGLRAASLVLSAVMLVGALLFHVHYKVGGIERATRVLIASSAVMTLLMGVWVLPALEPYRISGVIGRRLAELEVREQAKAILCTFDLPGVVYALGHSAPVARGLDKLVAQVNRDKKVIVALRPQEVPFLQREARLELDIKEIFRGFNLDKGRSETLMMTVLRPRGSALAIQPSSAVIR
ncbi:ArnT family glycosyltransferase [Singulisphaera acidiphila]|uniref:PMT family glycosyltransferase, 4-amino-4-deoxy-L-arabinose transferase n=1 Tax=Singulisphaera acidiphila (strain ATCC BAA-1392 / DSM 18658 / VKM B-2454 / MOB10) TaxID=886293 RepID=L0DKM6_SINAD|nr:glycosyltransferase family 39 protein [Singulisphaera acidiphila]AGA29393.1 PMT family glycosyltransferase, 4-amino-4-deoxy-L-arabinose transferase [Singulisphaera acidiphila DSM 18658]